jgi:ABC-type glycerol-3-phosphate transport system substrate-binding protein
MKIMNRILSVVAAAALAAGLLAGCGASSAAGSTASSAASSVAASSEAASSEAASSAEASEVKVQFTVTGADGESQTFDLEVTDGEKLSDALAEAGIISADEAAAGFVTTVNGETADWDKDSAWWCLTDASGEMTAVGVADIELHDGDRYAFTYTK